MPSQLPAIITFCAGRYNANRHSRPGLAKAFLAILNRASDLRLFRVDPERDLLEWLSKPHTDPDLAKAGKEVHEHVGSAHPRTARPQQG
jgi:hypothetical protein